MQNKDNMLYAALAACGCILVMIVICLACEGSQAVLRWFWQVGG